MTALPTYFEAFLEEIRPTISQRRKCQKRHKRLRERLETDEVLAQCIVSTFLQGSYRRATAVRPSTGKNLDVDVIVVTRLSKEVYRDPTAAMDLFVPFLERHYKDKYEPQGRSWGIKLSDIELDLVITSAPAESDEEIYRSAAVTTNETLEEATDWRLIKSWVPVHERTSFAGHLFREQVLKESEWKTEPLWIPDRDVGEWGPTHPLEQIRWTSGKNARCETHYVNVVKALKWWRQRTCIDLKYPKGYPLEHLIGACCPDDITSVGEGVTRTLEGIVRDYASHAKYGIPLELPDHGVPEHNVWARVTPEDFATFYAYVEDAAVVAREALSATTVTLSAEKWRTLFGPKFPPPPAGKSGNDDGSGGPFTSSNKIPSGDTSRRNYA